MEKRSREQCDRSKVNLNGSILNERQKQNTIWQIELHFVWNIDKCQGVYFYFQKAAIFQTNFSENYN